MDPERIWATVFGGDEELGLGPDEEAIEIWRSVGMPEERIVLLGRADNFWQAGPTGPCGPVLGALPRPRRGVRRPRRAPGRRHRPLPRVLEPRLHDLRPRRGRRPSPSCRCETSTPGWASTGWRRSSRTSPRSSRPTSIRPLIDLAEELSGHGYSEGGAVTRAMRIVADHSRGAAFLIADGVVPSNEDRGYILRRIMRRAIQQGRTPRPRGAVAGPLRRADDRDHVRGLPGAGRRARDDRPLGRRRGGELRPHAGARHRAARAAGRSGRKAEETSWIDADDAFKLHDTYGFPFDLTKELLAERGLAVDDGGFEELMEEQRERARTGAATAHGSEDHHERVIAFASEARPTRFVGYETLRATTGVAAVAAENGRALVKLEESPFYAEGGGQVADSGVLRWDGGEARSSDVYRVGEDQALEVRGRDRPRAASRSKPLVDHETRHATMRNHTATHLLHAALRERLGDHVRQAGSAVRPDKLRFDFTHGKALAAEDIAAIEDRVNEWIKASRPVRWLEMERGEAEAARGDGPVRREIRRVGAGRRGRRRLARALRRNPRRQHGRDRDLQDRLRGLERRQRAPDRGAERPGGDRLVPRARGQAARGRRAARRAAGPAEPAPAARRSGCARRERAPSRPRSSSSATRPSGSPREASEIDGLRGRRRPARADRRPEGAARPRRPDPGQARRGDGDRPRRRRG